MELRSSDYPLALVALGVEASSFWELTRSSGELTLPFSDHFLIRSQKELNNNHKRIYLKHLKISKFIKHQGLTKRQATDRVHS